MFFARYLGTLGAIWRRGCWRTNLDVFEGKALRVKVGGTSDLLRSYRTHRLLGSLRLVSKVEVTSEGYDRDLWQCRGPCRGSIQDSMKLGKIPESTSNIGMVAPWI